MQLLDYNEAIRFKPDDADSYHNRGMARRAEGDLDGALFDYNEGIRLEPDQAVGYLNRGAVRRAKGDLDGALLDYNEAIRLEPDQAVAYFVRGVVHQAKNDLDGALADYGETLRLKPDFAKAYLNRGWRARPMATWTVRCSITTRLSASSRTMSMRMRYVNAFASSRRNEHGRKRRELDVRAGSTRLLRRNYHGLFRGSARDAGASAGAIPERPPRRSHWSLWRAVDARECPLPGHDANGRYEAAKRSPRTSASPRHERLQRVDSSRSQTDSA